MSCIYCNSEVIEAWNLGDFPPSDTFCNSERASLEILSEKLAVGVCTSCGLTQNTVLLSEKIRYEDNEYAYSSANSSYAKSHWSNFTEDLKKKKLLNNKEKVLEVGANDGYLLNLIKSHFPNSDVTGLDASPFQVSKASENFPDIKMIHNIFGISDDLLSNHFYDIVIGNNVLNHSNQLNKFLSRVKDVLAKDGFFIFEVPALDIMFLKNKWDMIYHEHTSYFSINSILNIFPNAGFEVVSIELSDYHGGSFRVLAKQADSSLSGRLITTNYEHESLSKIKASAEMQRETLLKKIKSIKSNSSKKIYFFGAPAKGVTFINYCGLSSDLIEGCLENSLDKIGKFIPKSGLPIINEKNVEQGSYAINLLWNIPDVFEVFCKKNNLEEISYEIN